MQKLLLISDLDNTWVGDPEALQRLQAYLKDRRRREQLHLVYATGRSFTSAKALQKEVGLLEPDYWVTAVGSEIYRQDNLDQGWANHLSEHWRRDAIQAIADGYGELIPQSPLEQNPWKISYHLDPQAPAKVVEHLGVRLAQTNIPVQVIFSSGKDVDLLPRRSNKGNATRYLQKQLAMAAEKTLVCGDSGNDISLFETQSRGVIVHNAQTELLQWHRHQGDPRHYLAQSSYGAAILEAIAHFDLFDELS